MNKDKLDFQMADQTTSIEPLSSASDSNMIARLQLMAERLHENTDNLSTNPDVVPKEKVLELRKRTGMNRRQFCEHFDIPYRTMTEWEHGGRTMPPYVLRLMEYYLLSEELIKKSVD